MNNLFLIEEHDEALKAWREKKIKGLDLVHIDAHMDFAFQLARPIKRIIDKAGSVKELKRKLEQSLAFMRYEKDFDKQTNIGNYIYPAMQEGIVKDFYWVVPGGRKEFKESAKIIRGIIKSTLHAARSTLHAARCALHAQRYRIKDGIISINLFGRKFVICILEKLPILKQRALLDIDTDFLVIDSLLNADNTAKIGERKPWILPGDLAGILKEKIKNPQIITIAYSVNGGYTPMRYKVLGDELAYRLSPKHFKKHYAERFRASGFFEHFESTGQKEYYRKATRINPSYRAADNNYGPLYLSLRRFSQARKEFLKVLKVDPKNPYPLAGLGNIALEKGKFLKAKEYFSYALKLKKDLKEALFGLAKAEFKLGNFNKAKRLLFRYQKDEPLEPRSRYTLGCIYEREGNFKKAAICYQDGLRLGLNNIEVISRLLKIACHLKAGDGIIKDVIAKYRVFKKGFLRIKRLSLKKKREIKGLPRLEKKMADLERRLHGYGM